MKNLSEWLNNINQWTQGKIDLDLSRIFEVAKKDSKLLKFNCPVITIAGTNGKGSTVKTLESIYSLAGYSVGTYTSPHILHFNERIRYQNKMIGDEDLVESFEYIEKLRGNIPLTFFEFTTLSAFYFFQKMQPDVLILEVGMGGRLDAVNAIDADVAVITSIDFDHMDYLGGTLEAIGFEKAGIARPQKPLVFMDENIPASVEKHASEIDARLMCFGKDFSYQEKADRSWDWKSANNHFSNLPWPHLKLQNVAGALMVIELLQARLPVSNSCIFSGISEAKLEGRFEYSARKGLVLDVAHNPASMKWLAQQIKTHHNGGKKYAVFSMLKDKDISAAVQPLIDLIDIWLVAGLDVPRAETPEKITEILSTQGAKKWYTFSGIGQALSFAIEEYEPAEDLIVVCGSFHTVEQAKLSIKRKENGS